MIAVDLADMRRKQALSMRRTVSPSLPLSSLYRDISIHELAAHGLSTSPRGVDNIKAARQHAPA